MNLIVARFISGWPPFAVCFDAIHLAPWHSRVGGSDVGDARGRLGHSAGPRSISGDDRIARASTPPLGASAQAARGPNVTWERGRDPLAWAGRDDCGCARSHLRWRTYLRGP